MAGRESLLLPALRLLWWAVWAEVLLVRLLSRVGIYIPKGGTALQVYQGALFAGEAAFNLSLILAALLVIYLVVTSRHLLLGLAAGSVLLVPGVAAPIGWSLAAALVTGLALAGLGIRAIRRGGSIGLKAALAAVLLVHLLGYGVNSAQLSWSLLNLPGALPGAGSLLRFGELLALPAPLLLLLGARPVATPAWAAGVGGALALAGAYWANADLTAILALYALGFTLSWPAPLYLAALGAAIPAMLWLLRTLPARGLALGILLLAGYSLSLNQQHLLVLAGWATLALSSAPLALSSAPLALSSAPLELPERSPEEAEVVA